MTDEEASYVDYKTFLNPDFSPTSFANSLVLATNNSSDTSLDLSTPLSRVLFDVQEVDTHIHSLSTKSALPLLNFTKDQDNASQSIITEVEAQIGNLTDGYHRLEREVIRRYETADGVRQAAERLWLTVKIGRSVGRCLQLGRQLEAQMADLGASTGNKKEDHKSMVRAAFTLVSVGQLLSSSGPGQEGEHLPKIDLVTTLQNSLLKPAEKSLQARGQQIVREFSLSSLAPSSVGPTTYAQSEETKARTTSALMALYLLSPPLQLAALQSYLRTSLTSSLASIARALANLPSLDRTLLEVSYFWRSLAEGLATRVSELVSRGGVSARTLRSQKDRVRDSLRECVVRGSQGPAGGRRRAGVWEREAAVMVGSIIGALGR